MDMFTVYLPVAGIHFNVLVLLLIGFTVGVCGGFFGIGGAWIVTPALNIFGFPMPYAIGTDLAHMGGKSIVSTMRHGKFGNVDLRLGVSMIVGTTVGMELGARLVMALERAGLAESYIRRRTSSSCSSSASYVLYDYIRHTRRRRVPGGRDRRARRAGAVRQAAAARPHPADDSLPDIRDHLFAVAARAGRADDRNRGGRAGRGRRVHPHAGAHLPGRLSHGRRGRDGPLRGHDHRRVRRVHVRRQGARRPGGGHVDAARGRRGRPARNGGREVRVAATPSGCCSR